MDLVDRLLDYVATVPASESVDEVKDQLSAYTHRDLRAACMRLDLQVPRRLNKKGGFIATLVNYWKGEALMSSTKLASPSTTASNSGAKTPSKSSTPKPKVTSKTSNNSNDNVMDEEVLELAGFVEQFPADGTEEELRDQLNGCKSRTLRSTCVLLELQPHRTATKANFVSLLVNHWQGAGVTASKPKPKKKKEPVVTPKATARVMEPKATPKPKQKKAVKKDEEEEKVKPKRTRAQEVVEEKAPKKQKKTNTVQTQRRSTDRSEDGEEQTRNVMASSLEKAKVVQEWASAIEILSRVDGSDASISSIRALIDGVMESALDEL